MSGPTRAAAVAAAIAASAAAATISATEATASSAIAASAAESASATTVSSVTAFAAATIATSAARLTRSFFLFSGQHRQCHAAIVFELSDTNVHLVTDMNNIFSAVNVLHG